ncbi:hypothetical protein CsatB_029608 [Cannabis sativa]
MNWNKLSAHKANGGMGFRDFRDFNLAVLAKQGWRLLTCGDTLMGKIFKARYFSTGSFLTATLGTNPSYIWRSVLEAQALVRAGVRKMVGDGSTTNILMDPWLVDELNPFIESRHPALVGNYVNSLMKTDAIEWDDEVILDVLTERDQTLVFKIPLSQHYVNDTWYWMNEDHGLFTVKSAYGLQQQIKGNIDMAANSGFWKQLWQLKLPPKVLDFLWRASTNCLPTRFQLMTKHVPINTLCPFCNAAPETALHVLVRCPFAQGCWSLVRVPVVATAAMTWAAWFEEGLVRWTMAERLEASMVCWSVWKHRNELVWNAKQPVVSDVVTLAKLNFIDWYNAQKNNQPSLEINGSVDTSLEHWTPPQFPTIKINVDGAIFTNERRFGIGLVARTAGGIVLQAKKMSKMGLLKPHEVEAIGIKEALSWIKANAWTNVVVESDCLRVIRDIQQSKQMASPYGHIISECLALCSVVVDVSFNFVKRSANKVAHVLARSSLSEADCTLSGDALPMVVASLVLDDLV